MITVLELMQTYFLSCEEHDVKPNLGVLYSLCQAEEQRARGEKCTIVIRLYELKSADFEPLYETCLDIDKSEIKAVDIHAESFCAIGGTRALSLMFAVNEKIQNVYIQDLSFEKSFLWDLCQEGLNCQVLNLRSTHFQKLNMSGDFKALHTLILDNNSSITAFDQDCFACMPNLKCLSVCGSKVRDLWSTVAALSKLPRLEELRFQIIYMSYLNLESDRHNQTIQSLEFPLDRHRRSGDVRDGYCDVHSQRYEVSFVKPPSSKSQSRIVIRRPRIDPCDECLSCAKIRDDAVDTGFNFIPHNNASPICYLDHYRHFMINSLPNLKLLDTLRITDIDRKEAAIEYSEKFERHPYKRKQKENIVNVLRNRESAGKGKSHYAYSRSLCATKMESSAWPLLRSLTISSKNLGDMDMRFRPRQFEYHPSDSGLMVIGTVDGDVVVVNHENGKIVCHIPSLGALNYVLGLCWLKTHPSKFLAGSDNGTLKLYDIEQAAATKGIYSGSDSFIFEEFDQLTSLHVNSTDELFLTSGYSTDVALYDIGSGKQLQVYSDLHQQHINVVKFSNHSPSIFATASFDQDIRLWDLRQKPIRPCYTASSSKGNVMVCFSPDDEYLLASAVDNEVQQLLTVDGRVHLKFDIMPTSRSHNYTRAYYMNGKDYIITGSSDEHVVRVCCAQTGRRLRDISIEGHSQDSTMFVQSLRSDPFRDFNMSVLAAYTRPDSISEIVKVNMLDSIDSCKEKSHNQSIWTSNMMGG